MSGNLFNDPRIYIHPRQTVSLYYNSSLWQDMREARIETWLTLRQPDMLLHSYQQTQRK